MAFAIKKIYVLLLIYLLTTEMSVTLSGNLKHKKNEQ